MTFLLLCFDVYVSGVNRCSHMCRHRYVWVHVNVCFVCIHVEAWSWCQVFFLISLHLLHSCGVSQLNSALPYMASLAGHLAPEISCLCFPSTGIIGRPSQTHGIYRGFGDLNFGFHSKHYRLSHLHSSVYGSSFGHLSWGLCTDVTHRLIQNPVRQWGFFHWLCVWYEIVSCLCWKEVWFSYSLFVVD